MKYAKISLALLLTLNIAALTAKWINTEEIKGDLSKSWEKVKESGKEVGNKIGATFKKPKKFEIAPDKIATLQVENTDDQVRIIVDGVSEDILDVAYEGERLTITIQKK
jgi:HSP20 family molecular chaperone IbpA